MCGWVLQSGRRASLIRRDGRWDNGRLERRKREPGRNKSCIGGGIDERFDGAGRRLNRKNGVVVVGAVPQTAKPSLVGKTRKAQQWGEHPNNDHHLDSQRKERDASARLHNAAQSLARCPYKNYDSLHGVLAPAAAWRSAVIPGRPEAEEEGPPAAVGSPRESASLWAALLRRVFAIDVFACPRCGGRRRLVGVHTGGARLRALLERLGFVSASPAAEPARSPPRASQ